MLGLLYSTTPSTWERESGPLRAVHLSRRTVQRKFLIIFHGLGEGICCPLKAGQSPGLPNWWAQIDGGSDRSCELCSSREPTHYTLHPTPYTLHPTPYTLHPTPCTLHPTPYTQPSTPNPKPQTLKPKPSTLIAGLPLLNELILEYSGPSIKAVFDVLQVSW